MTAFSLFNKIFADYSSLTALITADGTKLTYSDVSLRASRLAAALRKKGVPDNGLVAIRMDRSPDYLISVAACLLFGYGFVPLDTGYPEERVSSILSDSKADFVITDGFFAQSAAEEPLIEKKEPEACHPCYVIYTSGSTGKPKGILHDQESLAQAAQRISFNFRLGPGDLQGVTAPFTFVALIVEVIAPWVSGAALTVINRNIVKDPELLARYINDNRITAAIIQPKLLRSFNPMGNSLRLVITGSEKICNLAPKGYRLVGAYGQSETCSLVSFIDIEHEYDVTPVGTTVGNNGLYLLDDDFNEVQEGEICVTGHFMTKYINQPELTAKTVFPNPFKDKDGCPELIRTGDLGRRAENGDVVYMNRKDWMIKINGQRVEPGEIEIVLRRIDGITNAVVKSFVNKYGQTYICAYYTTDREIDSEILRQKLRETLPSYMVPSFFVHLDEIPLNNNGKLDRSALKEPDSSSFLVEYVKPSSETEEVLCRAFARILSLDRVGVADDFFRLGGDSIKAVMVANECASVHVSVKDIFTGKTPRDIAAILSRNEGSGDGKPEEKDKMPLSDSQMGIFLDCPRDVPDCRYNIPFALSFPADLVDPSKLRDALLAAFASHAVFSLKIQVEQGVPFMVKNGAGYPDVEIKKVTEKEYESIKASFVKPFAVGEERLYRALIVETDLYVHLLLDIHHLIFDGTSFDVLQKNLCEAYEGKEITPEYVTQFTVSADEQSENSTGRRKESLEYFKNLLSACDTDSNISPDVCEPSLASAKGLYETSVNIDSDCCEYFVKNSSITENTLFAAAFAYALAKFTCQNQSLFVSVENGRPTPDMSGSVGMFVRSFPVFIDVDDERKTIDYLRDVQDRYFGAMTHDDASFADVVSACGFDAGVKFVYQSELLSGFDFNGVRIKTENLPVNEAMSNLDVMVMKQNGSYKVSIGYRKSMYSSGLISCFADAYAMIIDGLVKCTYLKDIKLVDEARETVLDSFNNTETPYNDGDSVIDMFRNAVSSYPDNDALFFEGKVLSYRELDRLTDNLASYIVSKGVKKGSFVAVMASKTLMMPVMILGVLKAGCAYQPLDPSYPSDRLNFMVKDSGAALLVTERELYPVLNEFTGDVLFADEITGLPDCRTDIDITPSDRFVLLYTSGTTGLPKGVMITHRNVVNLVLNHTCNFGIAPESRYATYASFGFDAFVNDMFSTLCNGAALYIIPEEIRLDLKALVKYYIDNKINHGFITTQLGCLFARSIKSQYLKSFMVGGEKLIPFRPSGDFIFLNGYGPSECVAYITCFAVKDDSPIQPIGKAGKNTKLYIADRYFRRMPVGCCGELMIAGPQVSDGYLNRPDKNSEAFISNPFTDAEKYSRIYRTGDITRYLPDGNIEFVGRRDGQVKIRGFRIELKEIECVIRKFEGITDVTVQAMDDPNGGKFLAAYIAADRKVDIDALNDYIADEKPAYMVPAVTMQLDRIPLNQNGKVDRRSLPRPERKAEVIVAAKTDMQNDILAFVRSLLGTDQVGITTDVFRAGLTSLGTIRLSAYLSDTYDAVIKTADLRENSTVEKLEAFLLKSKPEEREESNVIYPDYPITKTQEGIFIECQADLNNTAYNIPYLMEINGKPDVRRLASAICEAVGAHNYINTTLFYDANGNVRQKLAPVGSFTSDDVRIVKAGDISEVKDGLVKPFALIGGRLFRISIILASGKTYLFMDFHHIICDGTSTLIFLKDIEDAYQGKSPSDEKFTGFDVALSEQKMRSSHVYFQAEEYYQNLLAETDTGFLPHSDMHCNAVKGSGKLIYTGKSGSAVKTGVFCKKNNVSENSVLCTAFGHVLAAFNGTEGSLFTTVYNGRNDSRMGRTVSMLVKTLPVVFKSGPERVKDAVSEMSAQLVSSMSNDIYSFAEISRKFSVNADVMFIFQGKGFELKSFCGMPCSVIPVEITGRKAPLSVQVEQLDDCYRYTVECDPDAFTDDFALCLARTLDTVVCGITDADTLSDIALTDDESSKLLDSYNRTEKPFDRTLTVVDWLKKNASERPDRVAVSYKDTEITYAEFDRKTDALAAYLSENGVGKGDFIAILTGRNNLMPLAAWGVVKAGGAYLPIDPTYPVERINLMLSDSKAKILIAERDKQDLYGDFAGKVIFAEDIPDLPEGHPDVKISEDDPMILIYSSGSTGTPKGSILPHRSMNALNVSNLERLGTGPDDNVACYASFGFDAGFMDMFHTLQCGAGLYIIPDEIRLDIPAMDEFFIRYGITHGFMTTQVARAFLMNTRCNTLRTFIFGGEKMISFNPPKGIRVCNGYGPSESNCYVTMTVFTDDRAVQPIGKQNVNTKLYVIDKTGKRLPPYACGELCISGPQVALGYLNRPEKNASSFVRNPFCSEKDYAVMYRSGDIVRMFADGNYDFVGRRDGQVKIRGFRIELGEIEHIINDYPGVKQSTAQAFDDPNGGKFIAAYYVADHEISTSDMASHIMKTKPAYMVPAFMMQIERIPLTSNGKVNKSKLPTPVVSSKKAGKEPSGDVETKLCEIFASILNAEKIYADDDFFEMGGTSISALQLVVRCVNAGFNVVYKNLFDNPTPERLARFVSGEEKKKDLFAPTGKDAEKFDYSALGYNVPENLGKIRNDGVGDVLLTGATGFLGVHVLKTLLETTDSKVICLVRKKGNIQSEMRLKLTTEYYFEKDYDEFYGSRLFIVEGGLNDSDLSDKLGTYRFDTIINCAANVHHFGSEEALMRDNFNGINTLIEIAKSRNAKLIQTSSISVAGEIVNNHLPSDTVLKENCLNFGQSLENLYVRTKYMAEQAVINAVSRGLRGKVIRFGNLMARNADGEFQINSANSGFLRRVNGFRILGCYPVDALDDVLEFSPIDCAAKALILFAGTPDRFTVFHANNAHTVHMANVIEAMNQLGYEINPVESDVFAKVFADAMKDEKTANELSGILAYQNNSSDHETRVTIGNDNSYSVKALYRLGFSWPLTDGRYLYSLFENLRELDFFK